MDRRDFLKSSGLTTLAGLAAAGVTVSTSLAGTSLSDSSRILTLGFSRNTPELDAELVARRLGEQLEACSGGRLQIVAVEDQGPTAMRLVAARDLIPFDPAWAAFSPLAHGLTPHQYEGWWHAGGGNALAEELAHAGGLGVYPVGHGTSVSLLRQIATDDGTSELAMTDDLSGLNAATTGDVVYRLATPDDTNSNENVRLPATLAGEILMLVVDQDVLSGLTDPDRAILQAITAEQNAAATAENRVRLNIAMQFGGTHDDKPQSSLDAKRLEAARNARRETIRNSGLTGRQIIESQDGFLAVLPSATGEIRGDLAAVS